MFLIWNLKKTKKNNESNKLLNEFLGKFEAFIYLNPWLIFYLGGGLCLPLIRILLTKINIIVFLSILVI